MTYAKRLANVIVIVLLSISGFAQAAKAPLKKATHSIRLSAKQETVKLGEPAVVDIVYTNTSDHDIAVPYDQRQLGSLKVTNADGSRTPRMRPNSDTNESNRMAGPNDELVLTSGPVKFLMPGESHTVSVDVHQQFDLRNPGKYSISLSSEEPGGQASAKSNELTIAVVIQ